MEWFDDALALSARPHGEFSAIAMLLTRSHGRCAGLLPGGWSSGGRVQPGHLVEARWRARLADHLGAWRLEPVRDYAAPLLDQPLPLAALVAACAVVETACPERAPCPAMFDALLALLEALTLPVWGEAYVCWELGVLAELGFGLDLSRCAATGAEDGLSAGQTLTHVSPRTGRAVSAAAAQPYLDRLLPLPGFLIGRGGGGPAEVADGLRLTGWFLSRHLSATPPARSRLAEELARAAVAASSIPAPATSAADEIDAGLTIGVNGAAGLGRMA